MASGRGGRARAHGDRACSTLSVRLGSLKLREERRMEAAPASSCECSDASAASIWPLRKKPSSVGAESSTALRAGGVGLELGQTGSRRRRRAHSAATRCHTIAQAAACGPSSHSPASPARAGQPPGTRVHSHGRQKRPCIDPGACATTGDVVTGLWITVHAAMPRARPRGARPRSSSSSLSCSLLGTEGIPGRRAGLPPGGCVDAPLMPRSGVEIERLRPKPLRLEPAGTAPPAVSVAASSRVNRLTGARPGLSHSACI